MTKRVGLEDERNAVVRDTANTFHQVSWQGKQAHRIEQELFRDNKPIESIHLRHPSIKNQPVYCISTPGIRHLICAWAGYRASNREQKSSMFRILHKSKSSMSRSNVRSGQYLRNLFSAASALLRDRQARMIRILSSSSPVFPDDEGWGGTPSNIRWAIFTPRTLMLQSPSNLSGEHLPICTSDDGNATPFPTSINIPLAECHRPESVLFHTLSVARALIKARP